MVIAVALSALVAAMAYESFDGASRNAARTREVLDSVNKLDKAWQLIGQDMRNIVPLNAELPNTQVRFEAASQKTKGKDTFQVIMVFARRNLPLENIDFERDSFHQLLLDDVADVQVRFLSEAQIKSNGKSVLEGNEYSKAWEPTWPPISNGAGGSAMPIALEISIELEGVGRSVRLFEIPQK